MVNLISASLSSLAACKAYFEVAAIRQPWQRGVCQSYCDFYVESATEECGNDSLTLCVMRMASAWCSETQPLPDLATEDLMTCINYVRQSVPNANYQSYCVSKCHFYGKLRNTTDFCANGDLVLCLQQEELHCRINL